MKESRLLNRVRRMENALQAIEQLGEREREVSLDAIQALLLLDREGWSRAMARVRARDQVLADSLVDDELIAHLLLLHGLHPQFTSHL